MRMKYLAILLIGIAAGPVAFWWESSNTASAQQPPGGMPPAEVSILTISAKPIDFTKDLPGRASSYKIAEIRPQINGIVLKRLFEEGSDVKEGQQLYQIDPASYQVAVDAAEADLMKAEANSRSIVAKGERFAELVKIGGISKQEYDDVQASVAQGKADIAIAKAALTDAKINLDYTKVFSPIAGRIGKSMVTEGALLTANQQQPLATVQQFDPIYVDVTQSSAELMKLRRDLAGQQGTAMKTPVTLFIEGDTQPFDQQGELQFSDVSVDETTGSIQFRILFPNPEHQLLPGLFVKARIGQSRDDSAILVPQKAATRNADGSVTVLLVGDGNKVAPQIITVTDAVGDQWLVTKGLKTGDRVIVEGVQKAMPGSVVKPVEQAANGKTPPSPSDTPPQTDLKPAEQEKAE